MPRDNIKGDRIMTVEELKEALLYWQQKLAIQDWEIHLEIDPRVPTFNEKEGYARVLRSRTSRRAVIHFLNPEDWVTDGKREPYDMEQCLVHELLHIVLWFFDSPENENENFLFEQSIDILAEVLVFLSRKEEH
jgi:hypothetical protein